MSTNSTFCNHTCVADALGLGTLADGEPGVDPRLLRQLYRHARGEDDERVLFENDPTFTKGWVNLDSPRAMHLISVFVPLDEADNQRQARRMAQANLEAQPWNDVLGIDDPPIVCKVKVHGTRWGFRFQSAAPVARGRESLNEDLPTIPTESGPVDDNPAPTHSASPVQTHGAAVAMPAPTADDVLRRGGMPT